VTADVITFRGGALASNAIRFDVYKRLYITKKSTNENKTKFTEITKKSRQIGWKGGIPGRFALAVIEEALERSTMTANLECVSDACVCVGTTVDGASANFQVCSPSL
jgi:hypothetical protein